MSGKTVACVNELCSEFGVPQGFEPWSAVMCGPCGEWLRSPAEVAADMEHQPEYWEQYMELGAAMPGIWP